MQQLQVIHKTNDDCISIRAKNLIKAQDRLKDCFTILTSLEQTQEEKEAIEYLNHKFYKFDRQRHSC